MRPHLVTLLGLSLLLALTACGTPSTGRSTMTPTMTPGGLPPPRYHATVQSDVAYGPLPGETLDLCQPQGAAGLRPGVILLHGGGWTAGDKSEYAADYTGLCPFLAGQGVVAAAINYRLTPYNTWPAPLVDAQLAVRYLRANAARLQLDAPRLCSWGESAGGHLAVFLGVLTTSHSGDQATLDATASPQVACVVDEFGPVDLTQVLSDPSTSVELELFGFQTLRQAPAAYRDASPLFAVTPQSAPTFIVQGANDTVVPPSQSLALQHALEANHVPVHYLSYPGGHSFSDVTPAQRAELIVQEWAFVEGIIGQ
jgi:acetyl esterase/lipase